MSSAANCRARRRGRRSDSLKASPRAADVPARLKPCRTGDGIRRAWCLRQPLPGPRIKSGVTTCRVGMATLAMAGRSGWRSATRRTLVLPAHMPGRLWLLLNRVASLPMRHPRRHEVSDPGSMAAGDPCCCACSCPKSLQLSGNMRPCISRNPGRKTGSHFSRGSQLCCACSCPKSLQLFGNMRQSLIFRALMKASCGISTLPNWRMRFLPSFCLSRSLRLRVASPP